MMPQEVTRKLTILAEERGFPQLISQFQNLERAMSQGGASIKTTEKQFAALERQYFAVDKAQQDLARHAAQAFKAVAGGAVDAERGIKLLNAAMEKYNSLSSQKSAKESAGVFETELKRLENVRSRYDQAYKAARDYQKAIAEINELHKAGQVNDATRRDLLMQQRTEYRRVMEEEVNGGRLSRLGQSPVNSLSLHQARNMGFQLNDIITGVMSGQSLPMIAAQQGGQIFQILQDGPGGIGGSIKRLGTYLADLMTPMRMVVGGFVAIGVAAAAAFNSAINRSIAVQQSLNGIGAASGVSASQLMAIGRQSASAGNISNIAGIQYASQFAGAGISGDLSRRLTTGVRRFSQAFGGEEADVAKMLTTAFADPARGAEELNKRLGFLSQSLADEIKKKQALGDLDGARESLFKAYNAALQNATVQTNVLSEAFHQIKVVASNIWEYTGRLFTRETAAERYERLKSGTPVIRGNQWSGFSLGSGDEIGKAFQEALEEAKKSLRSQLEIQANRQSFIDRTRTRLIEDGSLNAAGVLARTSAEKALIESQRAYIQVMRETKDAVLANIAAENARNQALAEAQRALRDYNRAAADEAFLGGARTERERYMRQLQLDRRNLNEQTNILGPRASIPDSEWRAQVKYSEQSKNLSNPRPAPIDPFASYGVFPTFGGNQDGGVRRTLSEKVQDADYLRRHVLRPEEVADVLRTMGIPVPTIKGGAGAAAPGNISREITVRRGGFGMSSNAPGPVDQGRLANWDANKFGQMMHDAEVAIQAQNRALETQRANFGKSVEEVARFNEQTRMLNELERTGIPLTAERAQKIAEVATKFGEAAAAQDRFKETLATLNDMRSGFMDVGNSMVSAFMRGERGVKLLQAGINSLTNSLQRMSMRLLDKALFGDQNMSGGLLGSLFSSFMGGGGGISPLPVGMGSGTGGIYALGGAFSGGREITPFARGGVVRGPTLFPMANGAGLMGEAGPEAIMPLRRGPDGRLGVSGSGGGGGGVVIINENHTRTASMETKQEKGPDGRTIIRQIIREEVGGMIASGETDSANRGRYGIQARKVLRG
jgi:phage-related minor tail protein